MSFKIPTLVFNAISRPCAHFRAAFLPTRGICTSSKIFAGIAAVMITSMACAERHEIEPMRVKMIRHGETTRSSRGETIQGWLNDEEAKLNDKGRKEVAKIAEKLFTLYAGQVVAVVSSPLSRADDTGKIIADRFTIPKIVDPDFIEVCHGQQDGMRIRERSDFTQRMDKIREDAFRQKFPDTPFPRFFRWEYNPLSERPIPKEREEHPYAGKLETIKDVYDRGTRGLRNLGAKYPGEMIIVTTHGGIMDTLAHGIASEGSEEMLKRYYDPHLISDKRMDFPKHGAVCNFYVYPDGRITFVGVEDLFYQPNEMSSR